MLATALDPTLSRTLETADGSALKLVIANKNYSSWSMRPWVLMTAFGIPFEEIRILFDQPDTANRIAQYSAAGRVPVLVAGEMHVWDSLAICEYLAEQFPEKNLWPRDVAARAMARSICAEMHSGFSALRNAMPMHIRKHYPGKGRTAGAQAEIWEECMSRYGHHHFLFGEFSIADAYYAPVVMRFRTYGVFIAPALQAYAERVAAHPAVAQWVREALAETEAAPLHDVEPE
ncbi:MAG: glutathione S-transferase family protein [Pseudomonadota bacterium]